MGIKIPRYELVSISNTVEGFYDLLGPFLARREVVAELGSPVWDDNGKEWIVARSDEGEMLGFVAILKGAVQSFYVVPDARGESIGAALLSRILKLHLGRLIVTASPASVRLFGLYGFVEVGTRGKYTLMERGNEGASE